MRISFVFFSRVAPKRFSWNFQGWLLVTLALRKNAHFFPDNSCTVEIEISQSNMLLAFRPLFGSKFFFEIFTKNDMEIHEGYICKTHDHFYGQGNFLKWAIMYADLKTKMVESPQIRLNFDFDLYEFSGKKLSVFFLKLMLLEVIPESFMKIALEQPEKKTNEICIFGTFARPGRHIHSR